MKLIHLMAMAVVAIFGFTAAVALAGNEDKVTICHKPDDQSITLEVGDPALQAHLDHGDTIGACEDEPPTTTEPPPTTTEPPPTTTEPPPPPPSGGQNSVGVFCDFDHYVVFGVVDGQVADSATPATIPGNFRGDTLVTLHRGDTDWRTSVFTYGDCLGAARVNQLTRAAFYRNFFR